MGEDLGQHIKSSMFWNTVLPILQQTLKFVISIYIARLLLPKDFGIMGIASVIVFYANNITNFGLSNAISECQPKIDHL